jgi:predicted 3-demethylubiquinone-9 3-methyltransferase (glyoxalase superfamily)
MPLNIELFQYKPLLSFYQIQEFRPLTTFSITRIIKDQCGWLTDKFGLSWQIVPSVFGKLLHSSDSVRSNRVMKAMLQMKKLDINQLQQAYDGS